ncbi:MAG: hypothetical protein ACO1QB_13120 [Verrucomicrobiales bacterium]
MPNTVNDFINRFGADSKTVDDQQATQFFDRFASDKDEDRDFENDSFYEGATQHLGKLDDDEFNRASASVYQQAPPQQRRGLLQTILGGIQGRGIDIGNLSRQIGLRHNNPQEMDSDDYARLANYTRRQHPEVMRQAVQEQPWILKAMGNPIVLGALAMTAAHMRKKYKQKQQESTFR